MNNDRLLTPIEQDEFEEVGKYFSSKIPNPSKKFIDDMIKMGFARVVTSTNPNRTRGVEDYFFIMYFMKLSNVLLFVNYLTRSYPECAATIYAICQNLPIIK